ncbi:S26 family signal peptidase [Microbispora hainanensis]|uniref:Peptidase S26 domain-containing protein n=1 Tax=Microbispora hainanensis TaxID=568844 RepID=A0A544Z2Q5_9ACTN|nr:hypothetical protein FLX08_06060 [Microbispora hainanensis]
MFVALPAVCVVSILLLRSRFHVVSVFGLSMYPYLNAGDRVIIERRPDRCGRGDVVLIVSPGWPGQVIKRIAAVGGDRFPCDAGVVPQAMSSS